MKDLKLSKINSSEKAYIVGFIAGNGHFAKKGNSLELSVALRDKEIIQFISEFFDSEYKEDPRYIKKQRKFPSSSTTIYSKKFIQDLLMLFGGKLKTERRLPIISSKYELDFLRGFFDAKGCISWGYRKDRNRLWQKVSFTSQLKMLEGIQKILMKHEISSIIRPKSNAKSFILEFSNQYDVHKMYRILYKNCDTEHDSDVNAAINIKNFALRDYVFRTDTKNQDELPGLLGVLTPEAHLSLTNGAVHLKRKKDNFKSWLREVQRNYVSGTDTKNQDELPTVVGVLTPEAHLSLTNG